MDVSLEMASSDQGFKRVTGRYTHTHTPIL